MSVKVTEHLQLDVRPTSAKKYNIISIRTNREDILFSSDKPITSFSKQNSGKKVVQYLEKKIRFQDLDKIMEDEKVPRSVDVKEFKEEYIQRILSELEKIRGNVCGNFKEVNQVVHDENIAIEELKTLIIMGRKYPPLYQHFRERCSEYEFTPLEFITKICDGLGVGLTVEVLRAFIGYLQTYLGYKGTNVIAIGNQASGKSHIIESALRLIPQEKVHYGAKSVAYFFRKYNHQDLTGHIFYIGDLGGSNSDQNTIDMRDLLKQLSTDGYIERGVVDNGNDNQAEEQWVKGYPCLTYTTAHEDIINEQERSRSIIITPPDLDPHDLVTFKTSMKNQGVYASEIEKVNQDVESVKGLVEYMANEKAEFDIFNIYLYDIVEYIGNIDDFNRKVDEFDSILKLSCVLNKAKCIYHKEYDDEGYPLLLASKQDVRTALTIFDNNNNLLPNEVKLINGILRNFEPYSKGSNFSSTSAYEDYVKNAVGTLEGSKDSDWISENSEEHQFFFTERYLRSEFGSQRWYRANKSDISLKLRKLLDNNYLIKIGEDNKQPVYGINGFLYDKDSKVNRLEPNFSKENLCQGKDLFNRTYPTCEEEMENFIQNNSKIQKNTELFFERMMKQPPIYDLGWLKK